MYNLFEKVFLQILLLGILTTTMMGKDEPPVKKSKSGICHPEGSTYYKKTKNFIPFKTMEACIESGGRSSKR